MSSIFTTPDPKAYANVNANKVILYSLQDLTTPTNGNILISDAMGNFTSQLPSALGGVVQSVTAGDASITIGGTAQNPTVAVSGNLLAKAITNTGTVALTGPTFRLSQSLLSTASTGSPQTVTLNGTSSILTLTGMTLNAGATNVINVNNSAVTANSVINITTDTTSAGAGVSGLVCNINARAVGSFQFTVFNACLVAVTASTVSFDISLS
jgi:hypothetical protein